MNNKTHFKISETDYYKIGATQAIGTVRNDTGYYIEYNSEAHKRYNVLKSPKGKNISNYTDFID